MRVGNAAAPACMSCHAAPKAKGGTHAIVAKADPASTVGAANEEADLRALPPGRDRQLRRASSPTSRSRRPAGTSSRTSSTSAFSYLTTLTLLFFAFHVSIDFIYELRKRLSKKPGTARTRTRRRSVIRFDIHQRAQHWLMLSA